MAEDVKVWQIQAGDKLVEYCKSKLDFEDRLERWLAADISILSADLMLIGKRVLTAYGKEIDLLCLDRDGNVVIVELKRDRTPREVTAQTLDYASWVKDLSHPQVTEIANAFLGAAGPLEDSFRKRFQCELPEVLNESHRMIVVASEIDDSTERIIKYLSESYGVGINAATFHYFRGLDEREILARVFVVAPSESETNARTGRSSKRRPNLTPDQLRELAVAHGVGELYTRLIENLTETFDGSTTTLSSMVFNGELSERRVAVLGLWPGQSSREQGLKFTAYSKRLAEYLGTSEDDVVSLLPSHKESWKYYPSAPPDYWGYTGFFANTDEIDRFVVGLKKTGPAQK
jgi:hypothetical protein